MRRFFRILRSAAAIVPLFLCAATAVLWIRSLLAPSGAAAGLLNLGEDPDKWVLYARSGTMLLAHERSILDPAEAKRGINLSDKRSLLGFGIDKFQKTQSWPVDRGTLTYGTVVDTYFCPLWSCFLFSLILPLMEGSRMIRILHRRRRGLCLNCGYDLRASPSKCPECGHARNPSSAIA